MNLYIYAYTHLHPFGKKEIIIIDQPVPYSRLHKSGIVGETARWTRQAQSLRGECYRRRICSGIRD